MEANEGRGDLVNGTHRFPSQEIETAREGDPGGAKVEERLEQLEAVLEALSEGVLVVDSQGLIISANRAFLEMWMIPGEILLQGEERLFQDFMRKQIKDPQAFLKLLSLPAGSMENTLDTVYFKDGKILERSSRPLLQGGEWKGRVWSFRDITEQVRYAEHFKYFSLHDRLTGLYNRTFFEEELKRLEESREYPITVISADVDGLKMVNDTLGHNRGDELLKTASRLLKKALRRSDIFARIGGDEFVVLLPGTTIETGNKILNRIKARIEAHNRSRDQMPVSISLGITTEEEPGNSLEEAIKEADHLMYREKLRKRQETKNTFLESLLTLLQKKDFLEQGHGWRIYEWCRKMGTKLSLTPTQLENLFQLSYVHDLGKVAIPDDILCKKDPLTQEEWEVILQHPERGYRMALQYRDLSPVADLILKHHENWNGTGYPVALQAEEIPLECRILSIVDSFEVMTSPRPYRRAMTPKQAAKELKRGAGDKYSPALLEVFMSLLKEEGLI